MSELSEKEIEEKRKHTDAVVRANKQIGFSNSLGLQETIDLLDTIKARDERIKSISEDNNELAIRANKAWIAHSKVSTKLTAAEDEVKKLREILREELHNCTCQCECVTGQPICNFHKAVRQAPASSLGEGE